MCKWASAVWLNEVVCEILDYGGAVMVKCTEKNRIVLAALTLWLVWALAITGGCKKKDQPEAAQQKQDVVPQETEQISASEKVEVEKSGIAEKIDLRVLYVGLPDTERQKDFVDFLSQHFKQVDTADYNTFKEEQTKDCDVAIFDKDGLEWKALDINVSSQYSRATISMGVPGAFWVRKVSRRMGYM